MSVRTLFFCMFLCSCLHPLVQAEEAIELRNSDDSVRVTSSVVHDGITFFPGQRARYLKFAEELKSRTNAEFVELSKMTRGQQDFKDSTSGPMFEFVMLRAGQYITGLCDVPPKTKIMDQHCRFYGEDHKRISSDPLPVFQKP